MLDEISLDGRPSMAWILENTNNNLIGHVNMNPKLKRLLLPVVYRVFKKLLEELPPDIVFQSGEQAHNMSVESYELPSTITWEEQEEIRNNGFLSIDGEVELVKRLADEIYDFLRHLILQQSAILGANVFYFSILLIPKLSQSDMDLHFITRMGT